MFDGEGRSLFKPLLRRRATAILRLRSRVGRRTRFARPPAREAQALLHSLIPAPTAHILPAQYIVGRGSDLFREVCRHDAEGIVSKWTQSPYRVFGGRSPWLNVLNQSYSQREGRHELFDR